MKKLLLMVLVSMFSVFVMAKDARQVISEISTETGAQVFSFTKEMIEAEFDDMPEDITNALKNVTGGSVMILRDVDDDTLKDYNDKVAGLNADGYAALDSFSNEIATVSVIGKCEAEGDTFTDLLLVVTANDNYVLVNLTGTISKSDLSILLNKDILRIFG